MKTIGLIGGMSWESTVTYYQLLNRMARDALGGLHSAELILHSYDFAEIETLQAEGAWDKATELLVTTAQRLEGAGADCLLICTNTMHLMAEEVQAAISIPLLHIADSTAAAVRAKGVEHPLLLATRYTMEQSFYRDRLERGGVVAMVPEAAERTVVHDIIYDELCQGVVSVASKERYLAIVAAARERGADSVIFGCTEVGLLIAPEDFDVPSFDTTTLHAQAAIDFALA